MLNFNIQSKGEKICTPWDFHESATNSLHFFWLHNPLTLSQQLKLGFAIADLTVIASNHY